jgi:hypothetical protein
MYRNRIIATLLLVLFTAAVLYAAEGFYTLDRAGNKVQPASCTDQSPWAQAGAFSATGAEPATPTGENLSDYASSSSASAFDLYSKTESYSIPAYWNTVTLRCRGSTENHVNVFDVFLVRSRGDTFTRVATLTFTAGATSVAGSKTLLSDTVVVSNEKWFSPLNALSPTGDYIAMVEIDVRGFYKIGFVPTTLAGDAYIDIMGF